jgi:lysophospholipase L1-like esterase
VTHENSTRARDCDVSLGMRFVFVALLAACSNPGGSAIAPAASAPSPATPAPARTVAAAPTAPPVVTAPSPPPPKTPPPPKVVLQVGDSMVGGWGGLAKALAPKFEALGAHYFRDWERSVGIATFDHEHKLQELIDKRSPDLVLVTLGANDVSVPFPSGLAKNVQSIARKASAGGRACYWLAPPVWKKDTGIVAVIKKNAAPCKVFDASYMKIARRADGIHPTDAGGATWAEAFFAFYEGSGPATPNEPTQPTVATR